MSTKFQYSPQTGMFYRYGRPLLSVSKNGYRKIRFQNKDWYAHRLAWTIAVGPIPENMEIDHINRNRLDNRLSNLRVVSHRENMANQANFRSNVWISRNTTERRKKPWRVYTVGKYIGSFATRAEAEAFAKQYVIKKEATHD